MTKCPACKNPAISIEQKFRGAFYKREIVCPDCHTRLSYKVNWWHGVITIIVIEILNLFIKTKFNIILRFVLDVALGFIFSVLLTPLVETRIRESDEFNQKLDRKLGKRIL